VLASCAGWEAILKGMRVSCSPDRPVFQHAGPLSVIGRKKVLRDRTSSITI
jgi:hypothetical protein